VPKVVALVYKRGKSGQHMAAYPAKAGTAQCNAELMDSVTENKPLAIYCQ